MSIIYPLVIHLDIHARFTGDVEETIELIISRGRAASKTEAIRLAVLDYREHHLENTKLDELAVRKMQKIDEDIAKGKRKVLNAKEALGEKYAKMLE